MIEIVISGILILIMIICHKPTWGFIKQGQEDDSDL